MVSLLRASHIIIVSAQSPILVSTVLHYYCYCYVLHYCWCYYDYDYDVVVVVVVVVVDFLSGVHQGRGVRLALGPLLLPPL